MGARIVHESAYEDGGYEATVRSYWGLVFAVHYVANEVRVRFIGKRVLHGWRQGAAAEAARKVVEARLAELGPEFAAKHRALYAETEG